MATLEITLPDDAYAILAELATTANGTTPATYGAIICLAGLIEQLRFRGPPCLHLAEGVLAQMSQMIADAGMAVLSVDIPPEVNAIMAYELAKAAPPSP